MKPLQYPDLSSEFLRAVGRRNFEATPAPAKEFNKDIPVHLLMMVFLQWHFPEQNVAAARCQGLVCPVVRVGFAG